MQSWVSAIIRCESAPALQSTAPAKWVVVAVVETDVEVVGVVVPDVVRVEV